MSSYRRNFHIILSCITALLVCGCAEPSHVVETGRIDSLRSFVTPVRSIDPADTSFEDLEPLRERLRGVSVVMLGEQSHGDGATFLAKTRLVKFLHRELGYDVFAIESGLFDCLRAEQQIAAGSPVLTAAQQSTFDIWTASRQFQPLLQYIQHTRTTDRPLRYAGFDLQITGRTGRDSLTILLRHFLRSVAVDEHRYHSFLLALDTLTKRPRQFQHTPETAQQQFYREIDALIAELNVVPHTEAPFWRQVLRSIATLARFQWNVDWNSPDPDVMNLRDAQMAENLLWLVREQYPGRKIIVWAASSHISRNRHAIIGRGHADSAMVPMGHHVWRALRDSIYILGFTAYEGIMGLRRRNATVLAKAKPGTLEDIVQHMGTANAWVEFSRLPQSHWLRDTVRARPFGYTPMLARWPEMMDGMFFIRSMTPSEEVTQ